MKSFLTILIATLIALPALAARDKEKVVLCSGAASCSSASVLHFGREARLEAAVDADTGCPSAATYSIQGQNTGGTNWHVVATLSTASGGVSSQGFDPSEWFPTWRAVPSDPTGCSALEVNLWITRNQ